MHELQRAARFLDQAKDKAAVDTTIWCALKAILIHLELQEAALLESTEGWHQAYDRMYERAAYWRERAEAQESSSVSPSASSNWEIR